MWVRYQKISSKMASFDPRELTKNKEETIKYPLKRFETTLGKSLRIVIPTNLDRLRKHRSNIEKFANERRWKDLNMEQINASRTVQQLKATIRELDKVKDQLVETDVNAFKKRIEPTRNEALEAIQEFSRLYDVISRQVQDSLLEAQNAEGDLVEVPLQSPPTSRGNSPQINTFEEGSLMGNIQIRDNQREHEEIAVCQSWDHLRDGLVELNSLVKDFAVVVHNQQEMVDNIEDNIEKAHENVREGTGFLAQASKYKAAAIPVGGAIVGGIIGGPIGLMAGFKLAGVAAAVGGGIAGYTGGKYLKNKHDARAEMEMSNLSKKDDDFQRR